MKDLMTALETYVDARIEVDRLSPEQQAGAPSPGLGKYGSDLLTAAIERSNQARTDLAAKLGKLMIHTPKSGT